MLQLSIVCSDYDYMDRLDRYIRCSEWRDSVRLHRYTSIRSFVEADPNRLETDARELLLIEESLQDSELLDSELSQRSQRSLIVSLTTERGRSTTDEAIYMYQPVSRMLRQMEEIASNHDLSDDRDERNERLDGSNTANNRLAIIAVTSPYGGSGVTTVSRLLAQQLAMRYAKVLYLNMELYPKRLNLLEVQYDFSRFLYMLTTRPDELTETWTQYCGSLVDKVYSFVPPKIRREMRDMKSDYINLIGDRFRQLGFDAIVIDLDAHWIDDLVEGHIRCDESWIVLPWKHRKMEEFPELLPYVNQPSVKLIVNRTDMQEGSNSSYATKELEVDAILPYATSAFIQHEELVADDRLTAMISRVMRESAVLGGVAEDA